MSVVTAGVDEAGRGPLAGPVAAAAVILPETFDTAGITDSKALSDAQRQEAFLRILAGATAIGFALVPPAEIDRLNIRMASLIAMRRAVHALAFRPSLVLVDGRDVPPDLGFEVRTIIGGDASEPAIAAASIVAKVMRDRLMARLGAAVPGYGFEIHKGYPTPSHRAALERLGPLPDHRRSCKPVRERLARQA
jgi:ribonuclease HII